MLVNALVGGTVGVVVTMLTFLAQQRWLRKQEFLKERRDAYRAYLVAQQALHDKLANRDPGALSYVGVFGLRTEDEADQDDSAGAEAWRESGAAEMHARLVAGDRVFAEIDAFEDMACRTATAIKEHKTPPDWAAARARLIQVMRHDQLPPWRRVMRCGLLPRTPCASDGSAPSAQSNDRQEPTAR